MQKFSLRKLTLIYIVSLLSITAYADTAKIVEEKSYFDVKELNSPYVSWGVDPENNASINLLSAWKKYSKKKDVVVGVVDTGVDPTHVFLSKNIFVETGSVANTNFGADYSRFRKDNKTPIDVEGHGSHISGIIKSVYPDVRLLAIKYYDAKASGEESLSATVAALKYAVDNNVDLINYSGGGPGPSSQEYAILKEAERKGILVIVAAGNKSANIDDKNKAFYPASYGLKNVITVTAYDESLKLLNSSNYGSSGVDIAAPGYRIKSALQNGRTGYLTGTSQATAFVTGVAALIKSKYPQMTNFKIKEIIKASAKREIGFLGKCATNGRLDADAAITLAAKEAGETVESGRQLAGIDN